MITKEMKISEILDKYPDTIKIFISISPHFKKLENKILRKALASRVTLEQAASIAGVEINQLLFELNKTINADFKNYVENKKANDTQQSINELEPDWLKNTPKEKIIELDVRPILDKGQDPFTDIMKKVKALKDDEILLIINSFEPVPLYSVLGRKGFEHYTKKEGNIFKVYFLRQKNFYEASPVQDQNYKQPSLVEFEEVMEIDVRDLLPPEPMIKILETLSQIDEKTVLLVHHHREPLMLYPKLEERGYEAISHKIDENYYKVLIMKKRNKNE